MGPGPFHLHTAAGREASAQGPAAWLRGGTQRQQRASTDAGAMGAPLCLERVPLLLDMEAGTPPTSDGPREASDNVGEKSRG